MSGLTWGEMGGAGELSLDVEAAVKHLEWTFFEGDIVHLVNLRPKTKGAKTTVISMGAELTEMIDQLRESFDGICVSPWSTYYQIAPSTEVVVNEDGNGKGVRPSARECAGTRVLFADLDVDKDGAFKDRGEVDRFLDGMSFPPGSRVSTGTGGVHASWRLDYEASVRLREEMSGRNIGERWWAYLDGEVRRLGIDARIDRLIDLDARVLRLPGTIRFPKHAGDVTAPVVGEYFDVPDVSYDKFHELTDPAFEEYEARVKERRAVDENLLGEMLDITERRGKWSTLVLLAEMDALCERFLSWDEILTEAGWTYFRQGGDGSAEWTRPGGAGKSATVDWPESPEILSLFSSDESTGLWDLHEAEIHLTKWRVFLRLIHGDDMWAALDDLGARAKSGM